MSKGSFVLSKRWFDKFAQIKMFPSAKESSCCTLSGRRSSMMTHHRANVERKEYFQLGNIVPAVHRTFSLLAVFHAKKSWRALCGPKFNVNVLDPTIPHNHSETEIILLIWPWPVMKNEEDPQIPMNLWCILCKVLKDWRHHWYTPGLKRHGPKKLTRWSWQPPGPQ